MHRMGIKESIRKMTGLILVFSFFCITLAGCGETEKPDVTTEPIVTDIDAVTGDGLQVTGAKKMIQDGHLYILRDGKTYNANGVRVR